MPKFDVPENVLKASENIVLRDLLESPAFCYWAISCLCNATQSARFECDEPTEDDAFLQFKVSKILNCIPTETKRACFKETGDKVRKNREARVGTAQRLSTQHRIVR